jgi:hypothetical protein
MENRPLFLIFFFFLGGERMIILHRSVLMIGAHMGNEVLHAVMGSQVDSNGIDFIANRLVSSSSAGRREDQRCWRHPQSPVPEKETVE